MALFIPDVLTNSENYNLNKKSKQCIFAFALVFLER